MICSICNVDKPESDFVYRKDRGKLQPHCKSCKRNIDRTWARSNPDARRKSKTKSDRKLRQTKLITKLKDSLRTRLNTAVSNHIVKGSVSHVRDLGCSLPELITYLETMFLPGMNWSNRGCGLGTWQIDHKIPLCSANSEEELRKLVHYTNLQPIWWEEHLAKSATERR